MAGNRDDFSKVTIDILGKQVGYLCSNPSCRKPTIGANEDETKSTTIGVAAHITAAAEGGPRFNKSLTNKERSDLKNGIWLCSNCATLIDKDLRFYTVPLLNEWKKNAMEESRLKLAGKYEVAESIIDLKAQAKLIVTSSELLEEWNSQLDEILEELKVYKAKSAITRLDNLEKRIVDTGFSDDRILARLLWLKSSCMDILGDLDIQNDHAELLIRIYKLQPQNEVYKANAAQSYFILGNATEADKLATEILSFNEYNVVAWIVKMFIADKEYKEVLSKVPEIVRKKNQFKMHLYRWLAYKNYIRSWEDISNNDLHFDINYDQPIEVSHKNLRYHATIAGYLLIIFFNRNPEITANLYFDRANDDVDFKYAYKILKCINEALSGTEIESGYQYYFFYYFYCDFVLTQNKENIILIGKCFERIKNKNKELVLHMLQAYATFGTQEYDFEAIRIAETYGNPDDEAIILFKANLYSLVGKSEKKIEAFLLYVKMKTDFNKIFLLNFLSFKRTQLPEIPVNFKETLSAAISNKPFSAPEIESLFKVFCFVNFNIGDYPKNELIELVDLAKEKIETNDEEMVYEVALCYCEIDEPEKAKEYLKPIVDITKRSRLLKLYCKILYKTSGDKPELLEILEHWRNNFKLDYTLLQIEFELKQLQHKWNDAAEISKKGLEIFPDSEYFQQGLFISLLNGFQYDTIKYLAPTIEGKMFSKEEIVVNITLALHRAGCYSESINFLYNHAILKKNQLCRQRYIQMLMVSPEKIMQDYEIAVVGTFVKYQVENKTDVLELTDENVISKPGSLLLNKKIGDTFSIRNDLTGLFVNVIVLRISDKYNALFEELMLETENPLLGHVVQSFKFQDTSVEGMNKTFIDNFGVRGTLEQERISKEFNHYYEGKIGFTDIVISVFNQNAIDAYYLLTNQNGKPFKAIAPSVNQNVSLLEGIKFVLDYTSICLFCDLSEELGLVFSKKFYVSSLIREDIARELQEIKALPQSKLSVTITMDRVTPHFFDDGFKDRRIKLYQDLLNWIDSNCILEDVPERLNLIMEGKENLRDMNLLLNVIIDSNLLANRDNYLMLTNDVLHYRQFRGSTNVFVSPVLYLNKYFPVEKNEIIQFMLQRNYVGLSINSELLMQEFNKKSKNLDNRFQICIENLNYSWNPEPNHVFESTKFLRDLYLKPLLNPAIRDTTVIMLLKNLIVGMDGKLIRSFYQFLEQEFKLLGKHAVSIKQLFYVALREMQSENKLG